MVFDPDKKVEKLQKKRKGLYQSQGNSKPFENEGGEYNNQDETRNAEKDKSKFKK